MPPLPPELAVYLEVNGTHSGARSVISGDNDLSSLGELLRSARKELHLGVRETARHSGIAAPQIVLLEQGRAALASTYLRLAAFYGCRIRAHVTFDGSLASFYERLVQRRRAELRERDEKRLERNRARRRAGLSLPAA